MRNDAHASDMTRRSVLRAPALMAAAGLASSIAIPRRGWAATTSVKQAVEIGGPGGDPFGLDYPRTIGLRSGDTVDALLLNGSQYGGRGGGNPREYTPLGEDYWAEFEIHAGTYVDYVRFRSRDGIEVAGGGTGGSVRQTFRNVRVLRVGGWAHDQLDKLKVEFIENYQPSTVIRPNQLAVLDFESGGRTIKTFSSQSLLSAQAYERISEHSTEFTLNASAEGEYYAKFSVSTGLKTTSSTREDIRQSTQQALKSGETVTETLNKNEAKFLIGKVRVLRDASGNYWTYPVTAPNWVTIPTNEFGRLDGYYDFTSGLRLQTGFQHVTEFGFNKIALKRRRR